MQPVRALDNVYKFDEEADSKQEVEPLAVRRQSVVDPIE
jgi:hypothetical protein